MDVITSSFDGFCSGKKPLTSVKVASLYRYIKLLAAAAAAAKRPRRGVLYPTVK
jgi:hypothetical protein